MLESLQEESVRNLYQTRLDQRLIEREYESVEEIYSHVKDSIHQAAYEALGEREQINKKQRNLTKEIEKGIQQKKTLYLKWLNTKDPEDRLGWIQQKRHVKRMIAEENYKTWEQKCSEVERLIGGKKCTEAWNFIKRVRKDDRITRLETISIEEWKEYHKKLLSVDRDEGEEGQAIISIAGEDTTINVEIIEKTIRSLKNRKSPGPGRINAELIKNGTSKLFRIITTTINKCISEELPPREWKMGWITSRHKKGDRQKLENYRGITVTSTFSRLYGRVLRDLIEKEYGDSEAEEQCGFRIGRLCMDNIFCLKQIIEKKTSS